MNFVESGIRSDARVPTLDKPRCRSGPTRRWMRACVSWTRWRGAPTKASPLRAIKMKLDLALRVPPATSPSVLDEIAQGLEDAERRLAHRIRDRGGRADEEADGD